MHGLQSKLEWQYPGLTVTPLTISGQEWLNGADLGDVDAVVFALGLPTLEQAFSRALRKGRKQLPMLFTWLEPLDLGGHSVLSWTQGGVDRQDWTQALSKDTFHGEMLFFPIVGIQRIRVWAMTTNGAFFELKKEEKNG